MTCTTNIRLLYGFGLFGALLLLSGCGTTHYFVPAQPLGDEESAVYVTWHYDLNGLYTPNPVPDVHLYYGVNENWNLGIGLQAPVFVSHLSAVKYWSNEEDFAYGFLHLGQVAGANTNPLVEGGVGYAWHQGSFAQQLELGLAYGNGTAAPLAFWPMDSKYVGGNRFIPLARYQVAGADAGGSVQYYHGLTGARLRNLEHVAGSRWTGPDKLIRAADVDSVAFYPEEISSSGTDHLVIIMESGWQYDLFALSTHPAFLYRNDVMPFVDILLSKSSQLPEYPIDSLKTMSFRSFSPTAAGVSFFTVDEPFIGPVDSIAAALQRGEDVQVRSYADIQAEILRQWQTAKRGFWNDLSVGAAIIKYDK